MFYRTNTTPSYKYPTQTLHTRPVILETAVKVSGMFYRTNTTQSYKYPTQTLTLETAVAVSGSFYKPSQMETAVRVTGVFYNKLYSTQIYHS